jgi:hypothetical protein
MSDANFFDQFDSATAPNAAPPTAAQPPSATKPAANYFDQFDAPASTNQPSALSNAANVASSLVPGAGVVDAAAHFASGAVAPFAGGLTYLGTLGLTLDPDAAKAVKDATENTLTYQPRTKAGQDITNTVNNAAQATIGRATDYLSDKAADVGGPIAGAAARTTLEGAPYVLGIGPELSVARGAVGAAERAATRSAAAPAAAADAAAAVPKPAPAVDPDNIVGANAAMPPKFEAAPPVNAPEAPASAGSLSADAQASNEATLKSIGMQEARDSAVSGDKKAAASDYQQSKLDNEGGQVLSGAFDNERTALNNHADKLVADAGGSTGLDETSLHNRGQAILQPLQDLSDHLDNKISEAYQAADAKAQGVPAELSNTGKVLADRASFIGTTEGQQLLRGTNAYLRQAGIVDDAGTLGDATVQQAERLKQYLNSQWTPRTGRLISNIKNALDDDVLSSAGEDIYGPARDARTLRAKLLDDPQGVSSLLESSGPNGINRNVNVERIPDAVARMPVDQFNHVVDTLNGVPAEMRPQSLAALGEIRSQFMLRMQEAAGKYKDAWNNRGVTQYLNNNSAKLAKVFSPAELRQIKALNDAGNILDVNRAYPGAAVQGHNLAARGALWTLQHGAGVAGAHIAGPVGAGVGEFVGGAAAKALGGSLSKKAAQSRIRKFS